MSKELLKPQLNPKALVDNSKMSNLCTSQKILLMINKEQKFLAENIDPNSLMAFGAMGAHINMALKALRATESDQ